MNIERIKILRNKRAHYWQRFFNMGFPLYYGTILDIIQGRVAPSVKRKSRYLRNKK